MTNYLKAVIFMMSQKKKLKFIKIMINELILIKIFKIFGIDMIINQILTDNNYLVFKEPTKILLISDNQLEKSKLT